MLPSESSVRASSFGVSQGTVRKGARRVEPLKEPRGAAPGQRHVRRRAHPPERALFHFFHIAADDGTRTLPALSRVLSCRRRRATPAEAIALALDKSARVIEIRRVREMDGTPAIAETVCVEADRFADLDKRAIEEVPNELYQMYEERYGITVHRAVERLRAIAAAPDDAEALDIKPGTPLLEIERIAETLNGRPVERRVSRCLTDGRHYIATIV